MVATHRIEPQSGERPDVSFVVATHNVAPFIAEAIGSALGQRDVSVEVVVVDDGSSDGTADIVREIARRDGRVSLIAQVDNRGPSYARNRGMSCARGRWIAILDGDDTIAPDRSRHLIDLAVASGAEMVADNFERMTADGRLTGRTMLGRDPVEFSMMVDVATFIRGNVLFDSRARLGAVKPMVRNEFLDRTGIRMPEALLFAEDFVFCLALLAAGARFVVSGHRTYHYRMRKGSLSWRIGVAELGGVERELSAIGLDGRTPDIDAALAVYRCGLRNAQDFSEIVAAAKARRWGVAIRSALHFETMPLVLRFGSAAMWNRLAWLVHCRQRQSSRVLGA
jgi:succinoglycan biosynthesis protein ExoO